MPAKKDQAPTKTEYSSLVPAVEQASRVLLALAQGPAVKMTLTEICSAVGIHKSKGYSILNTLQHFAFVQRSPDSKTYALGPGLLFLSSRVLSNLDLREAAAPILRELAVETNSTAFLGLISDTHVFVAAKDEGMQDIGVMIRLGHRFPLAWGAHGKAIVAFLSDAELEEILSAAKPLFHGSPSKFDRDRLEEEIAECRKTGFAADIGGMKDGIQAVASPVFGPGTKLIGSLAVVGTFSAEYVAVYGRKVAEAAHKLSELIGGVLPAGSERSGAAERLPRANARSKQKGRSTAQNVASKAGG